MDLEYWNTEFFNGLGIFIYRNFQWTGNIPILNILNFSMDLEFNDCFFQLISTNSNIIR